MAGGALAGLRILDLGWAMAGPQGTRILADFGAEVLKIESRARLDQARTVFGPHVGEPAVENSVYFNNFNRNKRGVALNMSRPEGRAIFARLVAISDGVLENFSADVMTKWGFDYAGLCRIRPDIVYVSMAGLGHSGPYREYQTYGPSVQALSGLTHLSGFPDLPPAGWGYSYMDHTGGYMGAIAMMMALLHRKRSGRGQYIDLSQVEAGVALTGPAVLDYVANGRHSSRAGNASPHPPMAPHGVYRCAPDPTGAAGDDEWVAIAVATDDEWAALTRVLGQPQWAGDRRYATTEARLARQDELDARIAAWTRPRSPQEAMETLQAAGVPAGRVNRSRELFDHDPQLAHRGLYPTVEHPVVGRHRIDGMPAQLSRTPATFERPGPLLGEANDYVFGELLAMGTADIRRLEEEQVLW